MAENEHSAGGISERLNLDLQAIGSLFSFTIEVQEVKTYLLDP